MVSPEFQAVREAMVAQAGSLPETVAEQRAVLDATLSGLPLADGVRTEDTEVAGRPAQWVRAPDDDGASAVLYLHGGGYRIGSIAAYRPLASQLVSALGAAALLLDYRLAPEHPFPAAVHDALEAYRWLLDAGYAPERLAVAGDSAGGGLTVALLVAIRDRDLPQPAAAAALSPWADLTVTAASFDRNADLDPYFGRDAARVSVEDYLAGADPTDPLASPALADLSGLAPVLVQASTDEVLADDALALATALSNARGEVHLQMWPEMTHVWHAMAPMVPESVDALAQVAAFIRHRWPG